MGACGMRPLAAFLFAPPLLAYALAMVVQAWPGPHLWPDYMARWSVPWALAKLTAQWWWTAVGAWLIVWGILVEVRRDDA